MYSAGGGRVGIGERDGRTGDVRCFGEIGDVGQPLIHRHIERTIKLETRVDEFRGRARLNPISAVGGPNNGADGQIYIPVSVHILHRVREIGAGREN